MQFRTFSIEVDRGVATVVLRGTGGGNAMGGLVWTELPAVVAALDADEAVRAVVLRGAGECFSTGLDLRWYLPHYRRLTRHPDTLPARLLTEATAMQEAISAVAGSGLPWIAAVHGDCVGAGLDLVSACDIRLAAADASFSLREIRIGIVADLGSLQRLPHIVGAAATREFALTGRDISAGEALARGLVTRVLPDLDALVEDATGVAARIAAYAPATVAGVKSVLDRTRDMSVAEGLRHVALWNAAFLPHPALPDLLASALRSSTNGGTDD
ncbi:enoyl-CoA hydratase-related protein [Umezawaea sp. Da 62-37]|uniref:enoyl-CoA hydratase-related protein n=1 Tax=Umezawaea sp. Da 62-37 TaxID=3075927 RepID=UPI0028F6C7EA|nr:enoyl-CoA hydratase-related protein [Umezawaea sp. Da 62-37]WNV85136.1 enoyl-CoA hydratase-related protein [Umezawaea sp. Da 62-37]